MLGLKKNCALSQHMHLSKFNVSQGCPTCKWPNAPRGVGCTSRGCKNSSTRAHRLHIHHLLHYMYEKPRPNTAATNGWPLSQLLCCNTLQVPPAFWATPPCPLNLETLATAAAKQWASSSQVGTQEPHIKITWTTCSPQAASWLALM